MIYSSAKSLCNFLLLAQSWLKIVVASGANFWKAWRPEQNFSLAWKTPPQSSPARQALF